MSFVISSILPFPSISWWAYTSSAETVLWNELEPFRKMSYRNRYYIAGGNGIIMLSIPLAGGGRNQRTPMNQVMIDPLDDWQKRHYRTLVSAYGRSPYFEFYEPGLKMLFETKFERLSEFSNASFRWINTQLNLKLKDAVVDTAALQDDMVADLRPMMPGKRYLNFPQYRQVFEERFGFITDLSILDLLFAEGPLASQWLRENSVKILEQ